MKTLFKVTAVFVILALVLGAPAMADVLGPQIQGSYIEVRSCDVYTGPCFANAEMGLTGEEAILTWDVTKGSWDGVPLAGLKVIAVVRASATLGTNESPYPAKSILIVDERANAAQKKALVAFVHDAAGRLVDDPRTLAWE